jgi:3-keto-disaccharide hydrolase
LLAQTPLSGYAVRTARKPETGYLGVLSQAEQALRSGTSPDNAFGDKQIQPSRQPFIQAGPFGTHRDPVAGARAASAVPARTDVPGNRRRFLQCLTLAPAAAFAQNEQGFTSLFDGKTLDGWRIHEGRSGAFYVNDGSIVVHQSSGYPTWLGTENVYENFDFRCEFFVRGWMDSGVFIHAPEYGPPSKTGMKVNIFHKVDDPPKPESMGSIFPLVPPRLVNVVSGGAWNSMRILMDWPRLKVWVNDEVVLDLDVESVPDLRYRLRQGHIGLESLSYPIRFRNLRIRELPSKERWETLYEQPSDFDKWFLSEGKPSFEPLGEVLHGDGSGHLATKSTYRDFELQLYIRATRHHNGGVLIRTSGKGLKSDRYYEIQLHDVAESHYPTGSLYHYKRARYPDIEPLKWYLMQLRAEGPNCLVRINGETVLEYDKLENTEEGHIELQAHAPGKWTEFKSIRVKRLG